MRAYTGAVAVVVGTLLSVASVSGLQRDNGTESVSLSIAKLTPLPPTTASLPSPNLLPWSPTPPPSTGSPPFPTPAPWTPTPVVGTETPPYYPAPLPWTATPTPTPTVTPPSLTPVPFPPTSAPPTGLPLTCSINPNVDFTGNDIANRPSEKPEGCCKICSDEPGCNVWSWSNHNGGTCWLKSAKGVPVYTEGVHSALVSGDSDAACSTMDENLDYAGADIGNMWSATAEGCCDHCAARQGCGAFSWTDHNGGMCWFKSSRSRTIYKKGARSAVRKCRLLPGTDIITGFGAPVSVEITNVHTQDAADCCDVCRGYAGCQAFTWSELNGGTCWLKRAGGWMLDAREWSTTSGTI